MAERIEGIIDGRTLNFQPSLPQTIEDVASRLSEGRLCFVDLQPGDMTRYEFYLIPQTMEHRIAGRFGLGQDAWYNDRYLWFNPCNLSTDLPGDIVCLRSRQAIFFDLAGVYTNDYTRKVMTIFLDLVNQAIDNIEACRVVDGEDFIVVALDCFK